MPCPNCQVKSPDYWPITEGKDQYCSYCGFRTNDQYCTCADQMRRSTVYLYHYDSTLCLNCGLWISTQCGCERCEGRPAKPGAPHTMLLGNLTDMITRVVRDLTQRMARMEAKLRSIETYTKVLKVRQKRNGGLKDGYEEEDDDEEYEDAGEVDEAREQAQRQAL